MKRILLIISTIMLGTAYISAQAQDADYRDEIDVLRHEIMYLKERVNQLEQKLAPKSMGELLEDLPCFKESLDTDDEIHGLGSAEGSTPEQAKRNAIPSAAIDIALKIFPEAITAYSHYINEENIDSHIEFDITDEQKQFIFDNSQIICYETIINNKGNYEAFVVLSLSKNIKKSNLNNEELKFQFDSSEFKEEMRKQLEEFNKKNRESFETE